MSLTKYTLQTIYTSIVAMSDIKTKGGKNPSTKTKANVDPSNKYPFSEVSGFTGSKIFESLLLYGIENCDRLRNMNDADNDTFPLDKYYDLNSKLEHTKGDKEEKKKTPFNTGKPGKVIIQYICSRFTWEVKQIDMKDFNPYNIPQFILTGLSNLKVNISELIINTVEKVPISNLIKKSHGLEQELMTKIGCHIDDIDLNFYIAKTLVRFIKILAFNFSNEFWYNNAKTIGERNFRAVLSGCEAYLPLGSTSFHGIMQELNSFLEENVKKIEKSEKKKKKDNDNDSDEEPDQEPDEDLGDDDDGSKLQHLDNSKASLKVNEKKKNKKESKEAEEDHGSESDNSQASSSSKGKGDKKVNGKTKKKEKKTKKTKPSVKFQIKDDNENDNDDNENDMPYSTDNED